MIRTRTVYVMVSRTETGIGRLIRTVTRYPYNHVSLTLDPGLRQWYSFARYVHNAPLYSGFVRESVERLCAETGDAQVRVFRLEIPKKQADDLEARLPLAGRPDSGLIYNHFDALAGVFGARIPVPGCHTCLSFACEILDRKHLSIESLCRELAPWQIYEGPLTGLVTISQSRDDDYFSRISLMRSSIQSSRQLCTLLLRTVCHGFDSYMASRFQRTTR